MPSAVNYVQVEQKEDLDTEGHIVGLAYYRWSVFGFLKPACKYDKGVSMQFSLRLEKEKHVSSVKIPLVKASV